MTVTQRGVGERTRNVKLDLEAPMPLAMSGGIMLSAIGNRFEPIRSLCEHNLTEQAIVKRLETRWGLDSGCSEGLLQRRS